MKKRKDQLTQRVRFREDLVQESPVKKSFLKELEGVIKIGDFFCPMVPPRNSWRFNSAQTANPKSHISVNFVFRRLKDSLRFDSGCPILSKDHGVLELEHVKHSDLERAPSPNVKCTKCLALGHFSRNCRGQIRCWGCYNYGHMRRFYLQWRLCHHSYWAPKHNIASNGGSNERCLQQCTRPDGEEDPLAQNGNTYPFEGPVVPGNPELANNLAEQFLNQLQNLEVHQVQHNPQPDHTCNTGSIVQSSNSAFNSQGPHFVLGPHTRQGMETVILPADRQSHQ
jgi:hypothetical protein